MIDRRTFLLGAAGTAVAVTAAAAPTAGNRKLNNRLELWHEYSSRTQNLLARVSTTRETSLLSEPLRTTGSMLFVSPGTLVFRDDSADGSTTVTDASGTRIVPNRDSLPPGPVTAPGTRPAADWLAARLVGIFAPIPADKLIEGSRANVPKGRGYRIDLLPPRGSAIRRVVRSVSITLDPAVGAVTRIVVAEAQGDRVTLGLSDHRQNLDASDLTSVTEPLAQLGFDISI